jgi:hypothetical protein
METVSNIATQVRRTFMCQFLLVAPVSVKDVKPDSLDAGPHSTPSQQLSRSKLGSSLLGEIVDPIERAGKCR